MAPLCWMCSAFLLVAHLAFAEGVVTCSSSDLQRVLGDYSAICSGFFSDAFSLTSELGNYVHLLNLTALQLSTAVRRVQQVLLIFSYSNIFIFILKYIHIHFNFKYISLSAYSEVLRPGFPQSSNHPSPRAFRSDKLSHWFGFLCGLFLDKCCLCHHYCPTLSLPSGCLLLRRPVKAIVRLHELAGNYQLNTSIN